MPKILIGISIFFIVLSLPFGFLNMRKAESLRSEIMISTRAREIAERARVTSEEKLKKREADIAAAANKVAAAEAKASSAEADLTRTQNEKAEIESKLQAGEAQIADLQRRVADATVGSAPVAPEDVSPNEVKVQLDDTKKQLEAAEQEKSILADRVREAEDRLAAMEAEKKRRTSGAVAPGVRGTILAVNQAYNFVVLSVGNRQGLVPNSELLVMRRGALIGKIRISSVEPTTSIGDIITKSLARGVQVQPGDTVIYAGNNNS